MNICLYVHIYTYIFSNIYIRIYVYTYTFTYVYTCICTYVCKYLCTYVCKYIWRTRGTGPRCLQVVRSVSPEMQVCEDVFCANCVLRLVIFVFHLIDGWRFAQSIESTSISRASTHCAVHPRSSGCFMRASSLITRYQTMSALNLARIMFVCIYVSMYT